MSFLSFLGSGDQGAGLARQTQKKQQGQISLDTGKTNSIFNAFSPEFYAKAMQTFQNQQLPGVEQGFQQAQKGLGYNLARKGLTKSSSAGLLGESLAKSVNTDKQNVVNNAQGQVNQLKQGQGQQEAGLIQEAGSANSPSNVAQNAIGTASQFQAPGWFQGIGQTIGNWANTFLASQNKNSFSGFGSSFGGVQPSPFGVQGGYDAPPAAMSPASNIV